MIESVLPLMDPLGSDVSRLVKEYDIKMKVVIYKAAPHMTKSCLVKPHVPWFNALHLDRRRHIHRLVIKF